MSTGQLIDHESLIVGRGRPTLADESALAMGTTGEGAEQGEKGKEKGKEREREREMVSEMKREQYIQEIKRQRRKIQMAWAWQRVASCAMRMKGFEGDGCAGQGRAGKRRCGMNHVGCKTCSTPKSQVFRMKDEYSRAEQSRMMMMMRH